MKKNSGLTLMELMLVIIGMSVLFGIVVSTFLAASKAIHKQQERIPAGAELSQGLQKASRTLRGAVKVKDYNGIKHTLKYKDLETGENYVLYLYSQDDPNFNDGKRKADYVSGALYELRLAPEAGFVYGSGRILARYLMSPFALEKADEAKIKGKNDKIELVFTATEIPQAVAQKTEKVKMRLLIYPRNQKGENPLP